ncbi:MAG TPA: hypothetical protein VLT47_05145 [Anaeromyxobacteraceae bacterium]|nr:hypothetical protein [Anaeromyxobacteraceae bacterium]
MLVVGVFAGWAIAAALLVLQLLPDVPTTARGWLLLLVFGPPAYLALEWASGRMFNAETGARVSTARFSLARIAVALAVISAALVPFAWWLLRHAE